MFISAVSVAQKKKTAVVTELAISIRNEQTMEKLEISEEERHSVGSR